MNTTVKSLLKYGVAFALLAFVLHRAGAERVMAYLARMTFLDWLLSLSCVTLGQWFAGLRMRYFFQASGIPMARGYAVILAYVGAFYNFLLPGGIGGDAYKVVIARKRMELPTMQGVRIMLADRASGLCILLLMLNVILLGMDIALPYAKMLLLMAPFVTLSGYLLCSRWILKLSATVMLVSLWYSLCVQILWAGALAAIWHSLSDGQYLSGYIALYCAASVMGMIPASPGGLGIKEMTYFYGAGLFARYAHMPLNPDLGVTLSLCIFVMTFLSTLPGLVWMQKIATLPHMKTETGAI